MLDPYFQPYWRWVVEQMPMWLAPNVITFAGFMVIVASCGIQFCFHIFSDEPVGHNGREREREERERERERGERDK